MIDVEELMENHRKAAALWIEDSFSKCWMQNPKTGGWKRVLNPTFTEPTWYYVGRAIPQQYVVEVDYDQ